MKTMGELSEDFDADEDGERLDNEGPPLATMTAKPSGGADNASPDA